MMDHPSLSREFCMRMLSFLSRTLVILLIVICAASASHAGDADVQKQSRSDDEVRQYDIVLVEPSGRLRANHKNFWLHGVKLPRSKVCYNANGHAWGCGIASFVRWSQLLGHGTIRCIARDTSRDTWSCKVNDEDAATTLLRHGWATRDTVSDRDLDRAELFGREHGEGIWTSANLK